MSVGAERSCAVGLALIVLAIILPNISPGRSQPGLQLEVFLARAFYIAIAALPVVCIWVGLQRSRLLRVVGWMFLMMLLAGAFTK
jgi:hypothetical protein